MSYLYETKEWEDLVADVDRQIAEEGGSTGSNMAEPLYFPPGPARIPDGLPPEEVARREKASEGIREMLELARKHAEGLAAK